MNSRVTLAVMAGLAFVGAYVAEAQVKDRASALDGDTFRYQGETIRLLGIDTPEMKGHCRSGRECVEGDAYASQAALQTLLDRGKFSILRVKKDRYGRTVAAVRANRVEISCSLLRSRHAVYVPAWDDYGIVRQRCPKIVSSSLRAGQSTVRPGERG